MFYFWETFHSVLRFKTSIRREDTCKCILQKITIVRTKKIITYRKEDAAISPYLIEGGISLPQF